MLGGMGIAIHYEQLVSLHDGVPLIMAFGDPISGKSLAAEMAMSLFSGGACIGGTFLVNYVFFFLFSLFHVSIELISVYTHACCEYVNLINKQRITNRLNEANFKSKDFR